MSKAKVVLTRTENNVLSLRQRYPSVEWINFPLIGFDYLRLDREVMEQIHEGSDWLIFTSQNGVQSFFEQHDLDLNLDLQGKKIACVGPKTAAMVADFGYEVDFTPSHYTSLVLAKELPSTSEETICYIGGNLSSEQTISVLRERAKEFLQVEVYHTVPRFHSKEDWNKLREEKPDIISFCSPSAVSSFLQQTNEYAVSFDSRFAAIGSTTAAAIQQNLSHEVIKGKQHTFEGMVAAIMDHL